MHSWRRLWWEGGRPGAISSPIGPRRSGCLAQSLLPPTCLTAGPFHQPWNRGIKQGQGIRIASSRPSGSQVVGINPGMFAGEVHVWLHRRRGEAPSVQRPCQSQHSMLWRAPANKSRLGQPSSSANIHAPITAAHGILIRSHCRSFK